MLHVGPLKRMSKNYAVCMSLQQYRTKHSLRSGGVDIERSTGASGVGWGGEAESGLYSSVLVQITPQKRT